MNPDIRKLLDDIFVAERKYKALQSQLEAFRRDCRHKWGSVVYDPIVTQAYTTPGTMGVDWRGPCHVPRSEKARWKRECSECGDVEYTVEHRNSFDLIFCVRHDEVHKPKQIQFRAQEVFVLAQADPVGNLGE